MSKFVEMLKIEAVEFKMEDSDFLTFDNTRLVHGRQDSRIVVYSKQKTKKIPFYRTQYKDSADNSRTLIGAYIDWDHIYSKLRVLKSTAGN